ncbi:MAG: hypothetical protein ACLTQP_01575 [Faecalibacterium prausnitzii]
MNDRRVRFDHLQRKIIFIFAILENLRIFQNCFFIGVKKSRRTAAWLCGGFVRRREIV